MPRNSTQDRLQELRDARADLVESPWARWPVAGPRTFWWRCKFISEHAPHPLAHHSRCVQLSGLLSTDPAAQEHELLCRAIEFGLTFDQLQGAELSYFELLERRLQMLNMKHRDKVAGSLLRGSVEEDSRIYLGTERTRGLLMIALELEEHASGLLAKKKTAAARERRNLREERAGVPPAGGKRI